LLPHLCLSKGTPREGVAIVEALSEYPARSTILGITTDYVCLPTANCVRQALFDFGLGLTFFWVLKLLFFRRFLSINIVTSRFDHNPINFSWNACTAVILPRTAVFLSEVRRGTLNISYEKLTRECGFGR
jgi:hypothetical protein